MAELKAKVSSLRQKALGAIEDVPDNLIGFIIIMTILTVIGLGILMFLGYNMTR